MLRRSGSLPSCWRKSISQRRRLWPDGTEHGPYNMLIADVPLDSQVAGSASGLWKGPSSEAGESYPETAVTSRVAGSVTESELNYFMSKIGQLEAKVFRSAAGGSNDYLPHPQYVRRGRGLRFLDRGHGREWHNSDAPFMQCGSDGSYVCNRWLRRGSVANFLRMS